MLYTVPDYYKEFQCTADKCEDTCCAGWQIVIDKKSLEKYKKVRGAYRGKMLRSVNWFNGTFRQSKDKRCAFLNEDNLCDLYIHQGENSLCKTCKMYPRHVEEFEGLREITLSVSCPEVARLLMERDTPVKFLTYEKDGEEEYEDFDPFLFSIIEDAREAMLEILQNRELSLRMRTLLVLAMAHDIQVRVNKQEMFSCMDVIERYSSPKAEERMQRYLDSDDAKNLYTGLSKKLFSQLYKLELLRESWNNILSETEAVLFSEENSLESYGEICKAFTKWKIEHPMMDIHLEQILVYFLFTYFPGSVYDGAVFAKAQMAVYLSWMIHEIWMARWLVNGKTLDIEEMRELLYCFSREVEHSDDNLKKVEKIMQKKWML